MAEAVSRQRKWQIKHKAEGLCIACSSPAHTGVRCIEHLVKNRLRQRALRGSKPWRQGGRGRPPIGCEAYKGGGDGRH